MDWGFLDVQPYAQFPLANCGVRPLHGLQISARITLSTKRLIYKLLVSLSKSACAAAQPIRASSDATPSTASARSMVDSIVGSTIHRIRPYERVKRDINSASRGTNTRRSLADRAAASPAERSLNYGHLPGLVGYQVRKAHSRLFQTFTETLQDVGLAPGQYSALLLIGLNPGLSQMALADAAGIDQTSVAPITSRFAKVGWIRRTRRAQDRRVYSLRLTPQGEAVLARARPLIDAHEKEFTAALKPVGRAMALQPAERAMMRTLLARIADIETSRPADTSKAQASSSETLDFGPLPEHIGYQLRRAYSCLFRSFMSTFKHAGLAPGQYSALVLISLNPGLSQLDLAEGTGLDGSTIVPIIDRFVKLGWVRRVRRKSDRRFHALRITPAGQAVLDEALPIIMARERRLASILTADGRRVLVDMLARINAAHRKRSVTRPKSA